MVGKSRGKKRSASRRNYEDELKAEAVQLLLDGRGRLGWRA